MTIFSLVELERKEKKWQAALHLLLKHSSNKEIIVNGPWKGSRTGFGSLSSNMRSPVIIPVQVTAINATGVGHPGGVQMISMHVEGSLSHSAPLPLQVALHCLRTGLEQPRLTPIDSDEAKSENMIPLVALFPATF